MVESEKISAMLHKSRKKSFNSGVVKPARTRFCNDCSKQSCCDRCNNQVDENKEIESNLNLLKRHAPNQLGDMLSYYKL